MSKKGLFACAAAVVGVLAAGLLVPVATSGQEQGPNFSGQTIKKGQFGKKDWKNANFQKCKLDNCNFTEAKLQGADFRGAKIVSGYLSYADLTGADLRGASLSRDNSGLGSDWVGCVGTIFTKANLEGADLSGCAFTQASFRGANLRNLKGIAQANASDFTGADIRGADLSKMNWTAASAQPTFRNAIYDDKTKWPVSVTNPKEIGAIMAGEKARVGQVRKGERFNGKRFPNKEDFRNAELTNCSFEAAKLIEADFRGATIDGGKFADADLTKADLRVFKLTGTSFSRATLNEANLEGVDLSDCILNQTKFRNANLRNLKGIRNASACDFRDADLRGANLGNLTVAGARPDFTGARYDAKTIWPANLDPRQAGAVMD